MKYAHSMIAAALWAGSATAMEFPGDYLYFNFGRIDEMLPIYEQVQGKSVRSTDISFTINDLDGDGENEIIFRDTSQCTNRVSCLLTVARFNDEANKWQSIGQMYGQSVSLPPHEGDGFRDVSITPMAAIEDTSTIWSWSDELQTYALDLSAYGSSISWTPAAEAFEGGEEQLNSVLQTTLGQRHLFMASMKSESDGVSVSAFDLNGDEQPEYMLHISSPAICSDGCPLFLFTDLNTPPFAELTVGSKAIVVAPQEEGKLKSIYVQSIDGSADIFEWDVEAGGYTKR